MPNIQCLPKHVAELIAAGEVVERPASVVKELVENAIDAGASAIQVEIQSGGLTLIRITDNGCGIAPEQLPTAFLRHATSKLRSAEDLGRIGTLGFRGEALAAISAVSHIDIITCERGKTIGAKLHLDGGIPGEVEECGCPEGTTIMVRDLFYNMPARMKFMKKDSAEGTAVAGIVQHVALSHPEISFRLIRDGEETLHTPGDSQLSSAIYAAIGRVFAKDLLAVHGESGGIKVDGFITKPINFHGSRSREIFFINGRFVKAQLLSAAIEEAYKNQMMKGKYPGCVLNISMPLDRVDVNVHPAKTVVKFLSDKEVFDAVYYNALDTLEKEKQPVAQKPIQATESFFKTMSAQEFRSVGVEEKKPIGSYSSRPLATVQPASASSSFEKPMWKTEEKREEEVATPIVKTEEAPAVPFTRTEDIPMDTPQEKPVQESIKLTAEQQVLPQMKEAPWKIVGEVMKTYIVCEDDQENVWLIDKHAAHERIRFDMLKAQNEPILSQTLLTPVAVTLDADEYAAILENLDTMKAFGFACEDFGDGTILVREVPMDICAEDTKDTMEEMAHKLVLGKMDPTSARDELYHTMACKSAIKAGMNTDRREMEVLVEKVQSGEIQYCPHGRPVKVQMSKYQMEKMFKRA